MKNLEYYMSLPYQAVIKSSPEGGYAGGFPELPGCITQAETLEEMKEMLEDAKICWISLFQHVGRGISSARAGTVGAV